MGGASMPSPPSSSLALPTSEFSLFAEDPSSYKRPQNDQPLSRHVRASSDPISRGGAFPLNGVGLESELNPFESSFLVSSGVDTPGLAAFAAGRKSVGGGAATPSLAGAITRRARSSSPGGRTPGGTNRLIPGVGFLQSPGGLHNFGQYGGWGLDPNAGLHNGSAAQHPGHFLYDPSQLRTGLTPLVPGGNVSFPPPSPATAALFAMMTNNTPGTAPIGPGGAQLPQPGMQGGGPRPHEGPNEGNSFDASFGRTLPPLPGHQQNQLARSQQQGQNLSRPNTMPPSMPPQMINPGATMPQFAPSIPMRGGIPLVGDQGRRPTPQQMAAWQQQQQQQAGQQQQNGGQTNNGGQNPLYMLAHAHDLSHHDDAVVAAAALSNLGGGPYSPMSMEGMNGHHPQGVMPGAAVGPHGHLMQGMHPLHQGQHFLPPPPSQPPSQVQSRQGTNSASASGSPALGASNGGRPKRVTAGQTGPNKRKKAGVQDENEGSSPVATAGGKKAVAGSPAPSGGAASAGKRGRKASAKAQAAQAAKDEDDDDEGMMDMDGMSGFGGSDGQGGGMDDDMNEGGMDDAPAAGGGKRNKKPETDEEKRKNFLERNRQAALKCRQRKKAWLANLQNKVEYLQTDNETLTQTVGNLKEEIASLRAILAAHASCPIAVEQQQAAQGRGRY